MKPLLDQLAKNIRPMLYDLADSLFEGERAVVMGLVFSVPDTPVVFAQEAVEVNEADAKKFENTIYRYSGNCPFLSEMISGCDSENWCLLERSKKEAEATAGGGNSRVDMFSIYQIFPKTKSPLKVWYRLLSGADGPHSSKCLIYIVDAYHRIGTEFDEYFHYIEKALSF
ncbi:hypothetical protein BVX94_02215, partial [bacterium B17]